MAEATKTWPDASKEERDGLRHALGVVATWGLRQAKGEPPVGSVSLMDLTERMKLSTLLADVRTGRMTVERAEDTPEGHAQYRCIPASRKRMATIVRLPNEQWDVSVIDLDHPDEETE